VTPFVYDLPRLLWLREAVRRLAGDAEPTLLLLKPFAGAPRSIGVLAGSFNPLTLAHTAVLEAGRREGLEATLLLLPLRAVDKEGVRRATPEDRALVALQWAAQRRHVAVGLVNRGLYVEQAALLAEQAPACRVVFLVGFDKIVQIFDPHYYDDREAALAELFARATFRVAPRAGQGDDALDTLLRRAENRPYATGVTALSIDADVDDLSSSIVRGAASAEGTWEHLVPAEAAAFMRETRPYSPPRRLADGEVVDDYGLRIALLDAIAAGRLDAGVDFAALSYEARSASPQGRRRRAWLAQQTAGES
jgi:nicotinic acid mononucleotide adenylyltransferase